MHPRVIARIPNVLGDLLAWGRDAAGWWGLVVWTVRESEGIVLRGDVIMSAWMPAATLARSADDSVQVAYRNVVRLDLPADRDAWPTPTKRDDIAWTHQGVLLP